jgi:Dyp-type peroxidase family
LSSINFANIQGNILRGFNKKNVRLIFFNIESAEKAARFIRQLVKDKRIPSTADLLNAAHELKRYQKTDRNFQPRETWIHVGFSAIGIKKFGLELPPSRKAYRFKNLDQASRKSPEIFLKNGSIKIDKRDPFNAGMKRRSSLLGDVGKDAPDNWVEPFNKKYDMIDGVFRVDSDVVQDAAKTAAGLIREFPRRGLSRLALLSGKAIKNPSGKQIEHFGFRDGVSQPLFKCIDDEEIANRHIEIDINDPRKFILFGLKRRRRWANDGSFMVIRRLSQDVAQFWQFMDENSQKLGLSPESLAAKFVGRWKSGAPLAKFHDSDPNSPDEFNDNDFKYIDNTDENSGIEHRELNDPKGENTPRFAHIRKVYPRDDGSSAETEKNDKQADTHRIIRRGIPFGPKFRSGSKDNTSSQRGLIFVCYQIDLEQQFEFIQRRFANNPKFPMEDRRADSGHGIDPVIGKGKEEAFVNLLQHGKFKKIAGLGEWVTTTGGGYFFSPSITSLKNLDQMFQLQ